MKKSKQLLSLLMLLAALTATAFAQDDMELPGPTNLGVCKYEQGWEYPAGDQDGNEGDIRKKTTTTTVDSSEYNDPIGSIQDDYATMGAEQEKGTIDVEVTEEQECNSVNGVYAWRPSVIDKTKKGKTTGDGILTISLASNPYSPYKSVCHFSRDYAYHSVERFKEGRKYIKEENDRIVTTTPRVRSWRVTHEAVYNSVKITSYNSGEQETGIRHSVMMDDYLRDSYSNYITVPLLSNYFNTHEMKEYDNVPYNSQLISDVTETFSREVSGPLGNRWTGDCATRNRLDIELEVRDNLKNTTDVKLKIKYNDPNLVVIPGELPGWNLTQNPINPKNTVVLWPGTSPVLVLEPLLNEAYDLEQICKTNAQHSGEIGTMMDYAWGFRGSPVTFTEDLKF